MTKPNLPCASHYVTERHTDQGTHWDLGLLPYVHGHGNILITHLCTLSTPPRVFLCVGLMPLREPGQMVGSGDGGNGEGGGPHVAILYSDKLCSVDEPPALNKPVAAPGGGAFNTDNGRRGGWTEKVVGQEDATAAVALALFPQCVSVPGIHHPEPHTHCGTRLRR